MNFGSHVSIRSGYLGAAQTAYNIGCSSFQFFPKNPRSLMTKQFDQHDAEACARFCKEKGLLSIAHSAYLANLAVDAGEIRDITEKSLLNDLQIAEACASVGVVVHFGKYKDPDQLQGYKNILVLLNKILSQWNGSSLLLIENQSGSGGRMGISMEEMVKIRSLCEWPNKIGFCFDTCHAFASGLWNGENWLEVEAKGKQLGYLEHVKAVHLNDSMFPSGSFRDRHVNIGKGYIGVKNMQQFLRSSFLKHIPVVLETPASPNYSHQDEIRFLRGLL